MRWCLRAIGLILLPLSTFFAFAQEASSPSAYPQADISLYLQTVAERSGNLNQQIDQQTAKYLGKLQLLEARLTHKMSGYDSLSTNSLAPSEYSKWMASLQNGAQLHMSSSPVYVPHLDSLQISLNYLQSLGGLSLNAAALTAAGKNIAALQLKMNGAAALTQYIGQRDQQRAQWLGRYTNLPFGVQRIFNQLKETGYYYQQQIQEFKAIINNPKRIEGKVLGMLNASSTWQAFMAKHSMLATLFRLPGDYGDNASTLGYQTKEQIQGMIQQKAGSAGAGGGAILQQQIQQAHDQITKLQQQAAKYGFGGPDLHMPNFTPNQQKTKSFLKRLTYGASLQLAQATNFFPATANVGLSIGYKLNDKSTAGVGVSYNAGLGQDWGHIHFSNQGIGFRSFMDWKIKKTYYVAGGFEENHFTSFSSISQFKGWNAWQPSALLGLERKYKISSKLQGNVQLLFDLLYRQELPPDQPFKFRVGYTF